MAISQRFLDQLRARLTLSTVIGRRVRLARRGREHVGLCPFHRENTPSFTVSDDKGFYHCFGCGAHGDVISFVMDTQKLSFPEAVEALAAEAGLEVPRNDPRAKPRPPSTALDLLEATCTWFEQQLSNGSGRAAATFLANRGLNQDVIKRFRLGWAPGGGTLARAMSVLGFGSHHMTAAGLLKQRDDGTLGEYFRNRVVFPITDRHGRVIAFGGRIVGDRQPKYLNSPDSPFFHKGQTLYNLFHARSPARQSGSLIVVEGYMDVIALDRAGLGQAVAPLGSALSETQIEMLWSVVDEPILCFDGDAAGRRAAAQAAVRALPLLRPGKSLRFALLDDGCDPDDVLAARGAQALRTQTEQAIDLSEMLWRTTLSNRAVDTPERKAALEAHCNTLTAAITDHSIRNHYKRAFRDKCWKLFTNRGPSSSTVVTPKLRAKARDNDTLRRRILVAAVIIRPELMERVGEQLGVMDFPEENLDKLRQVLLEWHGCYIDIEAETLRDRLREYGVGSELDHVLSPEVMAYVAFCRDGVDLQEAVVGWESVRAFIRRKELQADLSYLVKRLGDDPTDEVFRAFSAVKVRGTTR